MNQNGLAIHVKKLFRCFMTHPGTGSSCNYDGKFAHG
jgi:hypothetical protein